ncbi:MAG TPA: nuclear transport factor 2 family protein [Dongiaceae bacterium]
MSVEDNVALMRSLYEAYSRRNPAPLFENLSEAVQFHFVAHPDHFTFAGSHTGKDGVQRALELIAQEYDWLVYQARDFIAEGDRVVALTDGVIQHRASGKELPMRMVDIIRIEDGRIVEFTEFFDSAAMLANDMAHRAQRAAAGAKARLRAKLPKKAAKKAKPKSRKPAGKKAGVKTAGARKSKALKPKAKKKPARRR